MTAQIKWNDSQRRLEIRFDSIPASDIRGEMKRRGFWWDGKAGVWHLARPVSLRFVRTEPVSQDGFEYALAFCFTLGLTQEDAARIRKARDFSSQQAAEMAMEEACGIR